MSLPRQRKGKGNSIQTVKNTAMHDIIKEIYKFPGQTGRRMLSERGMDLTGDNRQNRKASEREKGGGYGILSITKDRP